MILVAWVHVDWLIKSKRATDELLNEIRFTFETHSEHICFHTTDFGQWSSSG